MTSRQAEIDVRTEARPLLTAAVASALRIAMALLATVVLLTACYVWIDLPVATLFRLDHRETLYVVARFLTKYGEAQTFLIPALLVAVVSWRVNKRVAHRALYVFSCVSAAGLSVLLVKMLLGRARPGQYFEHGHYGFYLFEYDAGFLSFPSGHAAVFFSGLVSLAIVFKRWRVPLVVAAVVLSLTRVIVGVHYPSDIIAGALLGTLFSVGLAARWKTTFGLAEPEG